MRTLITGKGLVGWGCYNFLYKKQAVECVDSRWDLRELGLVDRLFFSNPEWVIHTAAKVGGLGAHKDKHSAFLRDNLLINTNVIEASRKAGAKAIFLSSVAAFPGNCSYLNDDNPFDSPVHESEYGYALSKRVMDEQIRLCRKEYNSNFCCLFPVNIYGPGDNFSLENGHCIASLLHKFYLAKQNNTNVEVWGDGLSIRSFIYVEDLVKVIVETLEMDKLPERLIVSHPEIFNISQVVEIIKEVSGFEGNIKFNKSASNGLRSRECCLDRLKTYKNFPATDLKSGIEKTWEWLNRNYENCKK